MTKYYAYIKIRPEIDNFKKTKFFKTFKTIFSVHIAT